MLYKNSPLHIHIGKFSENFHPLILSYRNFPYLFSLHFIFLLGTCVYYTRVNNSMTKVDIPTLKK